MSARAVDANTGSAQGRRGLYGHAIPPQLEPMLELLRDAGSLEDEIALLRVWIATAVEPDNSSKPSLEQLTRALHELANLVKTEHAIHDQDEQTAAASLADAVLDEVSTAVGVDLKGTDGHEEG